AIDGVLLADPAEIDLHARCEREPRAYPRDLVPADAGAHARDFFRRRHPVAAVEGPGLAQHAGRDVEAAFAQAVELGGEIEQVGGFPIDVHRPALRRVDAVDDVAPAIAAEFLLDAPGFFRDGTDLRPRHRVAGA